MNAPAPTERTSNSKPLSVSDFVEGQTFWMFCALINERKDTIRHILDRSQPDIKKPQLHALLEIICTYLQFSEESFKTLKEHWLDDDTFCKEVK